MQLFNDLEACNQIIIQLRSDGKSDLEIADEIAQKKLHPFIKFYAYKHLEAAHHITESKTKASTTERNAEACFTQIKHFYMRLPSSDKSTFSKLLILFAEFYADTNAAIEAAEWADSLQHQSWLGSSCTLLLNACSYLANFVIENPVKSILLLLLVSAATANAESQNKNQQVVDVIVDAIPPAQPMLQSTNDFEFRQSSTSHALSDLIALKIKMDPDNKVKLTPAIKQKCKDMRDIVIQAMKNEHHRHITRVLIDPKFSAIYCSDQTTIATATGAMSNGVFHPQLNIMQINIELPPNLLIPTISHEMLHADNHYRHLNQRCPTQTSRMSPPQNISTANIAVWNRAFDLGDARVEEFYQLWIKKYDGKTLSTTENKQLQVYEHAVKGLGKLQSEAKNSNYETYLRLREMMQDESNEKINTTVVVGERKIHKVNIIKISEYKNGMFRYTYTTTQPAQTLFQNDQEMREALTSFYAALTPELLLGEREAWTFMYLTELAAKAFYPEVYALKSEEVEQCATYRLADLNQHIRIATFFADGTNSPHAEDQQAVYDTAIDMSTISNFNALTEKAFKALVVNPKYIHVYLQLALFSKDKKDYQSACTQYTQAHQAGHANVDSYIDATASCVYARNAKYAKAHCAHGLSFFKVNNKELVVKHGKDTVNRNSNILANNCNAIAKL